MSTPTPAQIRRINTPDEIRTRIAMIERNLANPTPGCRASKESMGAARRDANKALRVYRAALRIR